MNHINIKNSVWKIVKKLSNLNLSLFILSLIIFICVIGSIVEQDQDLSYYKFYYSHSFFVIYTLGLDHVFRTWWFILLLFMLVISLIACTLSTQFPSLKNARRWKFMYSQNVISSKCYSVNTQTINQYSSINFIYSFISSNFFVFSRNGSIYGYKGLYGRIAPIFVHFSIITILLGSVYGLFNSFVVQEVIPNGEMFHLKNIVYSGFYSKLPYNLYSHVDNFYISYYKNGLVKQFFSRLSFYLNSKHLYYSNIIYVNRPLHFKNLTFYQTDWQVNALRISLNNNYFFQQKLFKRIENGQTIWVSTLNLSDNKKVLLVLTRLNNKILICNDFGTILTEVSINQIFYLNGIPFVIENVIASTGLQIKYDPSIFVVYLGFFFMMLTTFLSYLSYSQIWIYSNGGFLNFSGSTNRATLFFEQDIIFVNKTYIAYADFYLNNLLKNVSVLR
uniref:Cytochrome c biogenesis protein Ccs1 n=1 Tax=Kapraunia schneideri TaxID=717899 RepID=A0A1Z1MT11_9FLOR|nr:cytochrome c biogenesis protein ccs1 [Kapraunia schneideri]ARW68844.1 cytochrome c biogenesis protein ccs1 [Kapraunia schneideri]